MNRLLAKLGMDGVFGKAGAWLRGGRHRVALLSLSAFAAFLLYSSIFATDGLIDAHRHKVEQRELEQKCQQLREENQRMQQHNEAMRHDPRAVEHTAREQLHYSRPGEIVYTDQK